MSAGLCANQGPYPWSAGPPPWSFWTEYTSPRSSWWACDPAPEVCERGAGKCVATRAVSRAVRQPTAVFTTSWQCRATFAWGDCELTAPT